MHRMTAVDSRQAGFGANDALVLESKNGMKCTTFWHFAYDHGFGLTRYSSLRVSHFFSHTIDSPNHAFVADG
jgi:hypothetical protein